MCISLSYRQGYLNQIGLVDFFSDQGLLKEKKLTHMVKPGEKDYNARYSAG